MHESITINILFPFEHAVFIKKNIFPFAISMGQKFIWSKIQQLVYARISEQTGFFLIVVNSARERGGGPISTKPSRLPLK
jgi:hypothetical protein